MLGTVGSPPPAATSLRLWVEGREENAGFEKISNVAERAVAVSPGKGGVAPFVRGPSVGSLESVSSKWGTVLVEPLDELLGRLVLTYGEYEEGVVQALSHYVRPGDLVLDVGCNVGVVRFGR